MAGIDAPQPPTRSGALEFDQVFETYFDLVFRYAVSRVGRDSAEEVAAETFTEAFRLRHRYDPARGRVGSWLLGIATNCIHRYNRAELRHRRLLLRMESQDLRQSVEDPAGSLDRRLLAAIADLPRAQRDVVWLVDGADLSYEEAASALGVPVGTVRSRLSRARRVVRAALGAEEDLSGR